MSDVTSIRIHDKKGKQKFALENGYKSLCELTNFALDEYIKRFNAEQKNKGLMEEAFEAYKEHTKDDLVMETHSYTIALLKEAGILQDGTDIKFKTVYGTPEGPLEKPVDPMLTKCDYPWDNDTLSCPVCGKKHDKQLPNGNQGNI